MRNIVRVMALGLATSAIAFALPAQAGEIGVNLGGVSADVSASRGGLGVDVDIGGTKGVRADADVGANRSSGLKASADASVGGKRGVNGDVDLVVGGKSGIAADALVTLGGARGAMAALDASIGGSRGVDANATAGIGNALAASSSLRIGREVTGATSEADDSVTTTGRTNAGAGVTGLAAPTTRVERVAGLSALEVKRYKKRCVEILANAPSYDNELVGLCRMIR